MSTLTDWRDFLKNGGSVKTYFLICTTAFWLMVHTPLWAQKPAKKFKRGGVVQLDDSLTSYSQSDIFVFPNINKIKYYSDQAKLDRIKKLGPAGDEEQKYSMLKSYVSSFGSDNFSRDTKLLWDLARLSEKFGPKG